MKLTVLSLLLCALGLAGCNTVDGMGKDLERGGEAIQGQAQKR